MTYKKIGQYLKKHEALFRERGLALHQDHRAPLTRRDLLACGFYTAAYSLALPTLGQLLLSSSARADDLACELGSMIAGVPVLQVHFSGGRRLWGDGLAIGLHSHGRPEEYKSASGSFNTSDFFHYGLSPSNHPSLPRKEYVRLGNHPMPPISYIYQSALATLGTQLAEIDQQLAILSIATRTPDDSPTTMQNILPSATAFRGKADFNLVANGSGTEQSGLGNLPIVAITQRATVLNGSDISQLMDTGLGDVAPNLKQQFMSTFYDLVKNKVSTAESAKLLGCSNQAASAKVVQFAQKMDPFVDIPNEGVSKIFNANNNDDRNVGTIAYMLANNLALVGAINRGGFDYHDQTSGGYQKDYDAFVSIWKIIRYFHSVGKPLIIFMTSDGATYCGDSLNPRAINIGGTQVTEELCANTGDHGPNGGAMFMFLSPKGKEKLPLSFNQVGYGLPKGSVARTGNPIGYDQATYAAVAIETMRQAMLALAGSEKPLAADFQKASAGGRFGDELKPFLALK